MITDIMAREYVLGFAFSPNLDRVCLIQKQKPEWQLGRLNGVGGKIEPTDDTPVHAMIREFKEETSVTIDNWKRVIEMGDNSAWSCIVYTTVITHAQFEYGLQTREKEEIKRVSVNELPQMTMDNLRWLIPMSINVLLNRDQPLDAVRYTL